MTSAPPERPAPPQRPATRPWTLARNDLGFLEASPKPTKEELEAFYRERYYGPRGTHAQYMHEYSAEELAHKSIQADEALLQAKRIGIEGGRVLDVGCGEGFFLEGFARAGFSVEGLDFTADGIHAYHPHLASRLSVGDIYASLEERIRACQRYDVVLCNNVLEHVIEPITLLRRILGICAPEGLVRMCVPNDGSLLQAEIARRQIAPDRYWVHYPEHLSYFTGESLVRTAEATGFRVLDILADFPIDIFLLNSETNYVEDPARGRSCHFARVAFETALYRDSPERLLSFRRGCAAAGVGRNLIAYLSPDMA